jgi:flagellar motor protein MotB
MVNEILFDSGEATSRTRGIEVLKKVGSALAKVKDRPIEAQIDPTRLSATAHSEFQPRAANDTEEGRRSNRRIEIMLGPVTTGGEPAQP